MTLNPMPSISDSATDELLQFNCDVLDQALQLIATHEGPQAPAYVGPVGSHLRHVIEHYEALLAGAEHGAVDYDRRPRDRQLERCTIEARRRIVALQAQLAPGRCLPLERALAVRGQAGLAGDLNFTVGSTLGRELVFVASHAVHHYALLQTHCQQQGIELGADFGKAPATVVHERGGFINPAPIPLRKDIPCTPMLQAA